MSKFLLILGPSGTGKSSIIAELLKLDDRFVYISPFITRKLRAGEKDKIFISDEKMDKMHCNGDFLVVNKIYGIRYATPLMPIVQALRVGKFPVLDWPIGKINIMIESFPGKLYVVYVSPPSIEVLKHRLAKDGRDTDGTRLQSACKELAMYKSLQYAGLYNFSIVAKENKVLEVAKEIYDNYISFA